MQGEIVYYKLYNIITVFFSILDSADLTVDQLERIFTEAGGPPESVREAHAYEVNDLLGKIDKRLKTIQHQKSLMPGFGERREFQPLDDDSDELLEILQGRGQKRPADKSASELREEEDHPLQSTINEGGARFDGNSGSLTPQDTPLPDDSEIPEYDISDPSDPSTSASDPSTQIETPSSLSLPSLSTDTESFRLQLSDTGTMASATMAAATGGGPSGNFDVPFKYGFSHSTHPKPEGGFKLILKNAVRYLMPAYNFQGVTNPLSNDAVYGPLLNHMSKDAVYQPLGFEIMYDSPMYYCPPSIWNALPVNSHTCKIESVEVKVIPISTQVFFTTGSTDTGPVSTEYDKNIYKIIGANQMPTCYQRFGIQGTITTMTPVSSDFTKVDYLRMKNRIWGPKAGLGTGGLKAERFMCQTARRENEILGGIYYDQGDDHGINLAIEGLRELRPFHAVAGKVFIHHKYKPINGYIGDPWIYNVIYGYSPSADSWANKEQRFWEEAYKGEVSLMLQLSKTYSDTTQSVSLKDDSSNALTDDFIATDLRNNMFGSTAIQGSTSLLPMIGFDDMNGNWGFGSIVSDITTKNMVYNYYPFRRKNYRPLKQKQTADKTISGATYHYNETLSFNSYHSKIERADSFLPTSRADNDAWSKPPKQPPSLNIGMEGVPQKDFRTGATTWMSAAFTCAVEYTMVIDCSYKFPDQMFTEPNTSAYAKYDYESNKDDVLGFVVKRTRFTDLVGTTKDDVIYQIQDIQPPEFCDVFVNGRLPQGCRTGISVIPGDARFPNIYAQSSFTSVPQMLNTGGNGI